ncbi:MAG: hypothetical protein Q9162_002140 [Coniocarpon cinnabarinum]
MEDPSYNVPPALLEHVHLISSHRFPAHQQSLPLDTITEHLLAAPLILRDRAAVSWQYIRPPPNGTIFLAWQAHNQLHNTFATDGYIWPEPEQQVQKDCKGYVGAMSVEQVATHRRVRYRLVGSRGGDSVDSHLEIVHYTRGPAEKHIPVHNLPNNPQQVRVHKSRQYLENAGALERKEFMLSDKTNWPKITMPGQKTPSMGPGYGGRPSMPGMPNMPGGMRGNPHIYPPGAAGMRAGSMGAPVSSRQRPERGVHGGSRRSMPGAQEDIDLEMIDEESAALGDSLDQIRPRDISVMRFQQHHDWMDEVVSGLFSTNRIQPIDVILQCPGTELETLTEGLFTKRSEEGTLDVTDEDLQEFEKRCSEWSKKNQDELANAKSNFEANAMDLRTARKFLELEEKLKHSEADVDAILAEVDRDTGHQVITLNDHFTTVQKGGLLDKVEAAAMQQRDNGSANQQQDELNEFTTMDSAGEALDFYSGDLANYDADQGMNFLNENGEYT